MRGINRFIRWHPIWTTGIGMVASLLLIFSCVYGGFKIHKYNHPNDIYFTNDGLNHHEIPYECLDDQKWELIETPAHSLGRLYFSQYSLIPIGEFCSFDNDPDEIFIKDVGQFFQYSYVRKGKLPNVYDSNQIEAIILTANNRNEIEITKKEDIVKFLSFLESAEKKEIQKTQWTGYYIDQTYLQLKIKNHPVVYDAGDLFKEENTEHWILSTGFSLAEEEIYLIPDDITSLFVSQLEEE